MLGSAWFVLWVVNPDGVLFSRTPPTGGDLGAHVWGPAFLRDELVPSLRLTGWTPDWYAGFPAYHFYMVVPMLAVGAVDVGLATPLLSWSSRRWWPSACWWPVAAPPTTAGG